VKGGITADFVQDNQSMSRRKVLRGLHFQIAQPTGEARPRYRWQRLRRLR
jgi:dTDP-4-dehydrorhamnose 3,5-epimerase-like enzyme